VVRVVLLGIVSGLVLVLALAYVVSGSVGPNPPAADVCAEVAGPLLDEPLAGVTLNSFFSALILFVQYMSDFSDLYRTVRWLMGDLDTGSFGPAKAIGNAMLADGIDPLDQESVDRWIEDFNGRPIDERDALLGRLPGPG